MKKATAHSPDLLKRLAAEPLHEDVRVEGVGRATEEAVDGGRVGALHFSHFLEQTREFSAIKLKLYVSELAIRNLLQKQHVQLVLFM